MLLRPWWAQTNPNLRFRKKKPTAGFYKKDFGTNMQIWQWQIGRKCAPLKLKTNTKGPTNIILQISRYVIYLT